MIQNFIISWFRRETGLLLNIRTVRSAYCPLFFIIKIGIVLAFSGALGFLPVFADASGIIQDACLRVYAAEESPADVVVVIDPGHGGKNLGGEYEDYTEKDMTFVVAKAMKEELEKYEGITVYLTRTDDKDMSLEERCEYAQSVGADFLFCLHFNMSEYHTLFGAETWISAFGEEYSRGYAFASIEMELLGGQGLYSRGIKTKLGDDGQDYYGIIRHSTEQNIPCVLIEHCHLDQDNDKPFYDHNEKLQMFGKLDAEAVAKYYGLKSDILGKDYSSYENIDVAVPAQPVRPDKTEPDICIIELVEQNDKNGDIKLRVSAADYDSGMLYYSYSYDGGATFSELQRWPDKSKDTFEFTFNVPSGTIPQVLVNAYNGYDLYTASNVLNLSSMSYGTKDSANPGDDADGGDSADDAASYANTEDVLETSSGQVLSGGKNKSIDSIENGKEPFTMAYFMKVSLICIALVLAMIWSILIVIKGQKRKKRRRRAGK